MSEKELLAKIRELRRIQPRRDWVLLAKKNILGEEVSYRGWASLSSFLEIFRLKLIFVPVLAVFVLIGLFSFSQNSLPGDLLYPVKKITEKSQAVFVSEEEKPKLQLELTNKRLEELNKVAETNQVKNLAPALREFETTKTTAKKEVVNLIKNKSEKETIKVAKDIAPKLTDLNEKEKEVYASLNIESPEGVNQTAEKAVVEILIKDAKNSSLTEKQKTDLAKVEEYYKSGDYQEALNLFMTGSLNPRH